MNKEHNLYVISFQKDPRFQKALDLFNNSDWYLAHDAFEELWHEANVSERKTLQGFLQIAVAELHLENGNRSGATILFGEGLGRLRCLGKSDLGVDIEHLCNCVQVRLELLHKKVDPATSSLTTLRYQA